MRPFIRTLALRRFLKEGGKVVSCVAAILLPRAGFYFNKNLRQLQREFYNVVPVASFETPPGQGELPPHPGVRTMAELQNQSIVHIATHCSP